METVEQETALFRSHKVRKNSMVVYRAAAAARLLTTVHTHTRQNQGRLLKEVAFATQSSH